jgi:hypothetical protein
LERGKTIISDVIGNRRRVRKICNNNTTDKRTPKAYLKKDRIFFKQRYEANHASEPDYSKDDNMVLNLAYFNYVKANKLKVKASKRIKKLLSTGNGDNNPKKLRNKSNHSDNKQDEEVDYTKFDGPKKRCSKCGKWGNHTAEECTANGKSDNSSKSEEVNLASSGKGKTPARRVEKINFLDYNDSEDEEDIVFITIITIE